MMSSDLTFVFDEDGKAQALKEGKVVASADSVEELENIVKSANWMDDYERELWQDPETYESLGKHYDEMFERTEKLLADAERDGNQELVAAYQAHLNMLRQKLIDHNNANPGCGGCDNGEHCGGCDCCSKEASVKEADLLGDIGNAAKGVGNAVGDVAKAGLGAEKGYLNAVGDAAKAVGIPPMTPGGGSNPSLSPQLQQYKQQLENTPMMKAVPPPPGASQPQPGQLPAPGAPSNQNLPKVNESMLAPALSSKEGSCDCWDGYERVPGTKPCEPGSCKKCDDHRSKEKDSATHVVTPNGLRGKILGKTKDVWGDSVTVRFENGRIVQFPVSDNLRFANETEKKAEEPKVDVLRGRLDAPVDPDRRSLLARIDELKAIRREAADQIVKGASYEEEQELDTIALQAKTEIDQVVAALEHLADENTEPFQPFESQVVEQASLGSTDSSWLDETFGRMVSEANATDYDKLMDEGPEEFVAGLDAAALADSGVVREMASNYVRSKTAGANPTARETFESAWIDRVESLRREELRNRKTKAKKEAAAEENDTSNLPDDILFG